MSEQTKDHMFTYRSTMVGQDKAGRDTLKVYLDQDQVQIMIDTLTGLLENERGVKLTFHTGEKEAKDTGRKFLSTFGFVSAVQEGPGGRPATKKTFVAKTAQPAGVKTAAAKALGQQVS